MHIHIPCVPIYAWFGSTRFLSLTQRGKWILVLRLVYSDEFWCWDWSICSTHMSRSSYWLLMGAALLFVDLSWAFASGRWLSIVGQRLGILTVDFWVCDGSAMRLATSLLDFYLNNGSHCDDDRMDGFSVLLSVQPTFGRFGLVLRFDAKKKKKRKELWYTVKKKKNCDIGLLFGRVILGNPTWFAS